MRLGTPITKGQAREAAEHAMRCITIIRQWLPVKGSEALSSKLTMDDWVQQAGEAMIAFRRFHPTPGRYYTVGPQDFAGYWRELADGMMEIVDHYGWRDVDGEHRRPHSDVRGGQRIKAIDSMLLDRVEQAAKVLIGLAPETDDERADYGVELWNSGKTWREVTEALNPGDDVDQALIDSTAKQIKRHAKKIKVTLRTGTIGRGRQRK